jgi:hypothetical protein
LPLEVSLVFLFVWLPSAIVVLGATCGRLLV